ncbi:MAG: polymerase sigma factor SigW [Planctomycetota bacterium]|jgi:RNA polymerase sigma-70 factor (ECF subfamily)
MDARHRPASGTIRADRASVSSRDATASATIPDRAEVGRLLAQAAGGDSGAWRTLVRVFAPRVHGLLRAQCRDPELAEEITQSTFCTVAARIGDYEESGRFEPWLFRIAMNRLRDEMRRRARQARAAGDAIGEAAGATRERGSPDADAELRDRLRDAMARLGEADREIIDLRHVGGLSFKELSEYYDEPVGTLLARHHRALKKVRALLESMGVEAGDLEDRDRAAGERAP